MVDSIRETGANIRTKKGTVTDMRKVVVYYRDRAGLQGLTTQQDIARGFIGQRGWEIVDQVVETEHATRRGTRRELNRALTMCTLAKAVLFVPLFGQLSRNADVIGKILEAKVPLVTPDIPSLMDLKTNRSALEVMASVAEFEAAETKQKAKRGYAKIREAIEKEGQYKTKTGKVITKMGNAASTKKASEKAMLLRKLKADTYATDVAPVMIELQERGCRSSTDFAKSLTARGIASPRGKTKWTPSMAANLMERLGIERQERIQAAPRARDFQSVANHMIRSQTDVLDAVNPLQAAIDALRKDKNLSVAMVRRMFNIPYGVAARLKREAKRDGE